MQRVLEEVILLIEKSAEQFGICSPFDLALGGGVALNCKMTYEVAEHFKSRVSNIGIIGAAGDAGSSIGACINYLVNVCNLNDMPGLETYCLGAGIINQRQAAFSYGLNYHDLSESIINRLLGLINKSGIIGIARGRAEFGPRALGNRSIIADPTNPQVLSFINNRIKNREDFRPLAPIVLQENLNEYFVTNDSCQELYRSMLCLASSRNFNSRHVFREEVDGDLAISPSASIDSLLPAVVHHDGTARIQSYSGKGDDVLAKLLTAHKGGVLVNTSLNIRGEPIANDANDAIQCFLSMGLDALILEDIVVFREDQDPLSLLNYERKEYVLD